MPKVRRRRLPTAVLNHLLQRAQERRISYYQLQELYLWLASNPTVPDGRWFKRFEAFTICGEGDLVKTFLLPGQLPDGRETS
jgi:hypothetical protein